MKYETATAEKSTVKVTMKFDAEEWTAANDRAYRENRHKYAVNGFRKGKAPKYILEMYYGKGLFYEAALNLLFQDHYGEILEKEHENFTAVGDPEVALGEDFSEENIVLVATVPVKPDVTLGAYKGIKIPKYEYNVTDADVDAELDRIRSRFSKSEEVSDRPAQLNDTVTIDFVGKADGKEFEGGTAYGYDLKLGSGQFIPGFEEKVVGMTVGETKDLDVVFPEDYQAENLKGKPAVFTVTLHKITEQKLPEWNQELLDKLKAESLEEYTAKVRARLEETAKMRSRDATENAILNEIAKTSSAEIPDAMIDMEEEMSLRRLEQNLMNQGIGLNDYLNYLGTTREEYKKNFEEDAKLSVLKQLIVGKIIETEGIAATEEEIDARIAEQAASIGKEAAGYKETLDPRQLEYIENDIKVVKLFDFLMANNEMVKPEE